MCFGYAISKSVKQIKPFTDIKTIDVYENKYKVRTVVPSDPTKTINYKIKTNLNITFLINLIRTNH